MQPRILILALILFAAALVAPACTCDGMDRDRVNVECSCSGLAALVYGECNGEILGDPDITDAATLAGACLDAFDEGGEAEDAYKCLVAAACDADDCEEAAKRFELCAL